MEILSGATRKKDEAAEHELHERFAAPEYWIVGPELETVNCCGSATMAMSGSVSRQREPRTR